MSLLAGILRQRPLLFFMSSDLSIWARDPGNLVRLSGVEETQKYPFGRNRN